MADDNPLKKYLNSDTSEKGKEFTATVLTRNEDSYLSKQTKGVFDIVNEYYWTFTTPSNRRSMNIPYIELIEYEQDASTIYAQLVQWGSFLGKQFSTENRTNVNPYKDLYHALPTGTSYIFPYFESDFTRNSNSWNVKGGILDFSAAEGLSKIITGAIQALNLSPGVSILQPRVWDGAQCYTYSVNFTLFNTYPENGSIRKNLDFIRRLKKSCAHSQQNIILALPPAIFEIFIPGIRYSPASVISNLEIKNLGQMNLMNVDTETCNVPDAYSINITISELISESREIISAGINGSRDSFNKVRAILDVKDVKDQNIVNNPSFSSNRGIEK